MKFSNVLNPKTRKDTYWGSDTCKLWNFVTNKPTKFIGGAREGQVFMPTKFLAYLVILYFETRCSKQILLLA